MLRTSLPTASAARCQRSQLLAASRPLGVYPSLPLGSASPCSALAGRALRRARVAPPPPQAAASSADEVPLEPVASRKTGGGGPEGDNQLLWSLGVGALWLALLGYAFLLAPNQTPYRDQIFLERLVGLGEDDGFVVNAVFTSVFMIMGVYPAVYAALLVPAGRSENKVPAWPFVTLSFALGAFALLPYMAAWRPFKRQSDNPCPPPASELDGWRNLFLKGAETPIMPAVLLAGSVYYLYAAFSSDGAVWLDYVKLFDESRLVHVTTLDFLTLTALVPFWMDNDATARNWDKKSLVPVLSLIPVIGPCVYLLLRPKAKLE